MSGEQIDTLHFGWDWQVWTDFGSAWGFWMKCCPRCHAGPLTSFPDSISETCEGCKRGVWIKLLSAKTTS